MKVKCPSCGTLLNIPDSAAGKMVACPCGSKLRVPAVKAPVAQTSPTAARSSSTAASNSPTATPPPTRAVPRSVASTGAPSPPVRSVASAPTANATAATANPFTIGGFDDLTETDLQPMRVQARPGMAMESPNRRREAELLHKYSGQETGWENSIEASHPAGLKTLGSIDFFFACFHAFGLICLLGLASALPIPDELGAAKGIVMVVLVAIGTLDIMLLALSGVACFLDYKVCWFFLLFSYSAGLIFRVGELIQVFQFGGGWVAIAWKGLNVVFAMLFVAYMHSDEVKKFYRTKATPYWQTMILDGAGAVVAGGFVIAMLLLTRS